MKKYLPVILAALLASCNMSNDYHLPQAQMKSLLADLQSAETYSTLVKKDSTERGFNKNMDSLALYYKQIFAHYNVTQQQFDESLKWYQQHPDDLDTMYSKIIPELTKFDKEPKAK